MYLELKGKMLLGRKRTHYSGSLPLMIDEGNSSCSHNNGNQVSIPFVYSRLGDEAGDGVRMSKVCVLQNVKTT